LNQLHTAPILGFTEGWILAAIKLFTTLQPGLFIVLVKPVYGNKENDETDY